MARNSSPFQDLPHDVLQRVLAGILRDDQQATAACCKAFRGVIRGPRYQALRQVHGFAQRGIVVVASPTGVTHKPLRIQVAHKRGALASFSGNWEVDPRASTGSTTDGGTRLFVSSQNPHQILAIDVYSRRWRRLTTPPLGQGAYCMEWCGGRLYVAGGYRQDPGYLNSLHAFDETTGLWEELPPMPHACMCQASGVIGNQLFIAGGCGSGAAHANRLQIYDTVARTWRLGAPVPDSYYLTTSAVVLDGKFYLFCSPMPNYVAPMWVYDPQSNTWTEETVPWPSHDFGTLERRVINACTHNGRIIVFLNRGDAAHARAADGSWSLYELADRLQSEAYWGSYALGSVIIG